MSNIDNAPTSVRVIGDYSTGDPPKKNFKPRPVVVKIELPTRSVETIPLADLVSKDGKIKARVPANLVSRRFIQGERVAYFFATLDNEELEIGDRAPWPEVAW